MRKNRTQIFVVILLLLLSHQSQAEVVNLGRKAPSLQSAFKFLRTTNTGREMMLAFNQLIESNAVQIVPMTAENRRLYDIPDSISAKYDVRLRRIYIDLESPLGILAPTLLHEVTHALDEELHASHRHCDELYDEKLRLESLAKERGISRSQRKERRTGAEAAGEQWRMAQELMLFRTERKAFDVETALTEELVKRYPDYGRYLSHEEQRLGIRLLGSYKDEDIVRLYGLNSEILKSLHQSASDRIPGQRSNPFRMPAAGHRQR